ncbi:sulfotransferase domain protein [bacterium BMS3Bbin04]|nr:sulfotransferase domain protein [bacterium BMS3Bbin04]
MPDRLPNFLLAGVPKSGTSSMHSYLRGHPQIYLPDRKELHYFTHDLLAECLEGPGDRQVWERTVATLDEYKSFYSGAGSEPIVGESSPSYAYFHQAIPRILERLGDDLRVLIMIRNPIKRAHSTYVHMVTNQRETLSFHDSIMKEAQRKTQGYGDFWRYAEHGLYSQPIEAWIKAIGRDNLKVILLEEFNSDNEAVFAELLSWLGIDSTYRPGDLGAAYGHTGTARNKALKSALNSAASFAVTVKRMLPSSLYLRAKRLNATLNRANTSRADFPIEDRTWEHLSDYFREDLLLTGELIGKDLRGWLDKAQLGVGS